MQTLNAIIIMYDYIPFLFVLVIPTIEKKFKFSLLDFCLIVAYFIIDSSYSISFIGLIFFIHWYSNKSEGKSKHILLLLALSLSIPYNLLRSTTVFVVASYLAYLVVEKVKTKK